jgi:hypothetical protein
VNIVALVKPNCMLESPQKPNILAKYKDALDA